MAFVARALPATEPALTPPTNRQVSRTRAALAALDSTARQLPNPSLLHRPTLNREAQSTSALEGTYAPLAEVLMEDESDPSSVNLREIFTYVEVADQSVLPVQAGRPLTVGRFGDLQSMLVNRTPAEGPDSGSIRTIQVVIGRRADDRATMLGVKAARFVPSGACSSSLR